MGKPITIGFLQEWRHLNGIWDLKMKQFTTIYSGCWGWLIRNEELPKTIGNEWFICAIRTIWKAKFMYPNKNVVLCIPTSIANHNSTAKQTNIAFVRPIFETPLISLHLQLQQTWQQHPMICVPKLRSLSCSQILGKRVVEHPNFHSS